MRGPKRALSESLVLAVDEVPVLAAEDYRIAGVYSFGRGLFERGPIKGSDTSYTKLYRLHTGQLVVSRLKAFEGAVAVVPEAFDGWLLSPEFPTFDCIETKLDPGFLAHICRWPEFWSMLATASRGIGARRERVNARDVLRLEVGLPPIAEQRHLVQRLDRIQSVVIDLRRRTDFQSQLVGNLAVSISARFDLDDEAKRRRGWRRVPLGSVMTLASEKVPVDPKGSYPNAGIYSFGRGLFAKSDISGASTSAIALNKIRAGQFIYSRLFAFEGAYAYVPAAFDNYFVSNEFPTFDPDPGHLKAEWLAIYLRSPACWAELAGSSKGLGVRRQRVPVEAVLAYEVWLPPLGYQERAVAEIEQIAHFQSARAKATARVESLLPAHLNTSFAGLS